MKLADCVRRDLAVPQTSNELDGIAQNVAKQLQTIDSVLSRYRVGILALPAPSRAAYQYLSSLNVHQARPTASATDSDGSGREGKGLVPIPGIRARLNLLLDDLAAGPNTAPIAKLRREISGIVDDAEGAMRRAGLSDRELTADSHTSLTWLRFLCDDAHLSRYVCSVGKATEVFSASFKKDRVFRLPAVVHFRPLRALYRAREHARETRVHLAAPMITFDEPALRAVAGMLRGGRQYRQQVLAGTRQTDYLRILRLLDEVSEGKRSAAGAYHNLEESFVRINTRYFENRIQRPTLSWSERITKRQFGYYNFARDEIVISASMDSPAVSTRAVDFVVYHELLHKKHGVEWRKGRQCSHTRAFRREERLFDGFELAHAEMDRLAARLSGAPGLALSTCG